MSLKMAILGQLMDSPKSGYEIKAAFRDRISNFWHVSDGQLYPTLRKLTEAGMIRKQEMQAANGQNKHEYTLTEAGRKAFGEWLRDTESIIPEMKEPFLLKMLFFEHLNKSEQLAHVDEQILQTSDLIEDYRDAWRNRSDEEMSPYERLVGDAGLIILEARRLYLEQLRKGIENGDVSERIPLFNENTIELGKEIATQMFDMFANTGSLTIADLLSFTQGDNT